ncbi:YtpR family tRNA-binding protein [Bacillus sp. 179-C3.3 HS]|uniref:YtpR family tRNA-binding protein n=1 Tax=Bacillus sp. 179-C3.3 HS TaxID=3232162 RepID=UPI0039A28E2A
MNVFYNAEGVGDTLLISLKDVTRDDVAYETFGDVVRIFHLDTKETTGFNIFNASTYMKIEDNGSVPLSETLVQNINDILNRNGVSETLTVDLSPKFVVGYVKEKEKHPNADKLNICQVDVGEETLQIVCGAPNVDQGQYVVVAKVGAVMPSGMVIKDAELRGVPSSGMICSAKELDLPNAPTEKGILVLEGSRKAGEPFEG